MKTKVNELSQLPAFELIHVIVNIGTGSKVLHTAKKLGISGGTVFYGRGTVNNSLLKFLSLYDVRKEIILLGSDTATADDALMKLNNMFQFEKPQHGIAFTTSVCNITGSRCCRCRDEENEGSESIPMYQLITTIINKGEAEDVIEAANAAGSKGGTIINARGSGAHETSRLFNMEIEPEKEIVMIIVNRDVTEAVVSSIREKLGIDKPGHGIILIQDVNHAYGIYDS